MGKTPVLHPEKLSKLFMGFWTNEVEVQIDASKLWTDPQKYYLDHGMFRPNISGIAQYWADCLTARLPEDTKVVWMEKLLELST